MSVLSSVSPTTRIHWFNGCMSTRHYGPHKDTSRPRNQQHGRAACVAGACSTTHFRTHSPLAWMMHIIKQRKLIHHMCWSTTWFLLSRFSSYRNQIVSGDVRVGRAIAGATGCGRLATRTTVALCVYLHCKCQSQRDHIWCEGCMGSRHWVSCVAAPPASAARAARHLAPSS